MSRFHTLYLAAWLLYGVVAAVVAARSVRVSLRGAARFLAAPWKIALFVPAIVFVTFAGRFTDDETWDVVSGGGMSILTVATSWWTIGTLVRARWRWSRPSEIVVAVFVALFSASWFYDGYLLLRDGAYTHRWLGNLMISPVIYACAGLVANLEVRDGRLGFAFARREWPLGASRSASARLAIAVVPLVALAAYGLVAAVGWRAPYSAPIRPR